MAHDQSTSSGDKIEDRIQKVGRYSRAVRTGLLVILTAFVLALVGVLPQRLDSLSGAIETMLMPLTFVGLGIILYGIGMHLHLLHLNLVRQLQPEHGE